MTVTLQEHSTHRPSGAVERENNQEKTLKDLSGNLARIGKVYSKNEKLNPQKARELVSKQMDELEAQFASYKSARSSILSNWKDSSDILAKNIEQTAVEELENKINITRTLLSETSTQQQIIASLLLLNESELTELEGFVPIKYQWNKAFEKELADTFTQQETILKPFTAFLSGESIDMPSFSSADFDKHTELITKALRKPGALLSVYEYLGIDKNLPKNQEFIKIMDDILAQEYPDFFGKIQNAKWYKTDARYDFNKMTTLLDIVKYRPTERQNDFIEMMDASEKGESGKVRKIYDDYFTGTEIGNGLMKHFTDTSLIKSLKIATGEVLWIIKWKQENVPWSILDLLDVSDMDVKYMELFSNIPPIILQELFTHISEMEAQCPKKDLNDILRIMDRTDSIDPLYKEKFLSWLVGVCAQSSDKVNMKFYMNCVNKYVNQIGVSEEKEKIEKNIIQEDASKRWTYRVLVDNFPCLSNWSLEKKNERLKKILEWLIDFNWMISIDQKEFKNQLLSIFKGSPIEKKLQWANGGKIALQIIAAAALDAKEYTSQDIKAIDPTFNDKTINDLYQNKPEEYKKLRALLLWNETIDVKLKALKQSGVTTKEFREWDDKEGYVKLIQAYFKNEITMRATQSILADAWVWWKLEIFEAYYRGEIKSPNELNAKLAERDQEIKQQKERQWEKEIPAIPMKSYDNLSSLSTGFSSIPNNQIITYKIGNNDVFIRKDSKNEISIFAEGIPMRGIKINDEKNPGADIQKAMDSVRFLKESGVGVFGTSLPKMIDIINNKLISNGKNKIDFSDGLTFDGTEEKVFLQYISALIQEPTLSIGDIQENFRTVSTRGGGLLAKLQAVPGYVTNNSLNMTTILDDLEKVQL